MKINEYMTLSEIEVLSDFVDEDGHRWSKEVKYISWEGGTPVFDIRYWKGGKEYSEGVQLTDREAELLIKGIQRFNEKRSK